MTENRQETVLDVVINHYVDNRVRYNDAVSVVIPEDHDEQLYLMQDMIRSALIARIKSAGHIDIPITDGMIHLDHEATYEIDHFPIMADLKKIIPALSRKGNLAGLLTLIRYAGQERWIVYPAELMNVTDVTYIKSSVAARALVKAADNEHWDITKTSDQEMISYLIDQATEVLIRIWIKEHGIVPKEYAKWRVQGKQAIRAEIKRRIVEGSYEWE